MIRFWAVVSTILFMLPSSLNRFPFLYYDSAFYLFYSQNRIHGSTIIFRPLIYSALLGAFHSLILMVFFQSAWLNLLIYKAAETLQISRRSHFFIILISIFFTPVAIYSNYILPDVFVAIQFLSIFTLFYSKPNSLWKVFLDFLL